MKRYLAFMLAVVCVFSSFFTANAFQIQYDGNVVDYNGSVFRLVVNGKEPELPLAPIIFNDRALVPVREVFEALDASVFYDERTKCIDISYDDNTVSLYINKSSAYINGKLTTIPDGITPKLIGRPGEPAKTMVPVRFISENLNMKVSFEDDTIVITSGDYIENEPPQSTPAPSPAPTPTPEAPAKPYIYDIAYEVSGANTLVVTAKTNTKPQSISSFTLESPVRLVVDVPGCELKTPSQNYAVNTAGVTAIRLGFENNRSRIVLDAGSVVSYNAAVTDSGIVITCVTTGTPPEATPPPSSKPENPPSSSQPSSGKLIVIDAGHGGADGGASGTYGGVTVNEKDLTLAIAKKVKDILVSKGYNVEMTRETDVYPTLTERAEYANALDAAIFVSIHINAATVSSASGTEVYYAPINNDNYYGTTSSYLAKCLLDEILANTGAKNRGVKESNHLVTRTALMPAALVEVGFISNEGELSKMMTSEYQIKVAQGIAAGIIKTIDKVTVPSDKTELTEKRKADLAQWEN